MEPQNEKSTLHLLQPLNAVLFGAVAEQENEQAKK
jgi:hypothetical protein